MRTTVEINDAIYRQIKARTSLRGQTVKSFLADAIREKLQRETTSDTGEPIWMSLFGAASAGEVSRIQAIIDEDFGNIREEDWK